MIDVGDGEKTALLNLIGNCFYRQGELGPALGHYEESLILARKIKDKEGEAVNLGNIGLIYQTKGERDKVLNYYNQALTLFAQIGAKREVEIIEDNIRALQEQK